MKRDSFGAALSLIILFLLSFIYLPLPGLDVPSGSSLDFDVENQGQGDGLFAQIRESRNLDRPFPEMPMREDNPQSREKVELGQLLYFDPILSGSNDISCAHCHHPDLGFSDNRGQSMGMGGTGIGPDRMGGAIIRRGSPTIWPNSSSTHSHGLTSIIRKTEIGMVTMSTGDIVASRKDRVKIQQLAKFYFFSGLRIILSHRHFGKRTIKITALPYLSKQPIPLTLIFNIKIQRTTRWDIKTRQR
jgi:hypothetical protein